MLFTEDLDKMHCSAPGCDHLDHDGLYLKSKCHQHAGVEVLYQKGVLAITCNQCNKPVCEISVAHRKFPQATSLRTRPNVRRRGL